MIPEGGDNLILTEAPPQSSPPTHPSLRLFFVPFMEKRVLWIHPISRLGIRTLVFSEPGYSSKALRNFESFLNASVDKLQMPQQGTQKHSGFLSGALSTPQICG
jgi:hypothetical protein